MAKYSKDPAEIKWGLFFGAIDAAEVQVTAGFALRKAQCETRVELSRRECPTVARLNRKENARELLKRSMQPDDRNILRQCFFHDLSGAASARGGLTIPDGDEEVRLLKNNSPGSFISNVGCIAHTIDLKDCGGFGEQ